jgi:hypothetical protein
MLVLTKYQPVIARLRPSVRRAIADHFQFSYHSAQDLYQALSSRGLGQADVVLALIHSSPGPLDRHTYRPEIEALIARPITLCPPQLHHVPLPSYPRRERGPDDLVVRTVVRNPRLPTTDSFQRFKQFRPGVSIARLLTRGVTRKDIREARQNGWVEFA